MTTSETLTRFEANRTWEGLIVEIERALEARETNEEKASLHMRLGEVFEEKFLQKVKALQQYQKAFKLNPTATKALEKARAIYREMGKLPMVAQLIDIELKTVESSDRAVRLLVALGDVLADLGEVEKARACLARALEIVPGDASATAAAADLDASGGWEARVRALVSSATEIEKADPKRASQLLVRSARIARRNGGTETESLLRRAAMVDPLNEESAHLFEEYLSEQNRLGELLALQLEMVGSVSDDRLRAEVCMRLGSRWVVRYGSPDQGAQFLERALELRPDLDGAFNYLRELYGSRGEWARLVQLAERGLGHASSDRDALFLLAQAGTILWQQVGDVERATQFFRRLQAVAPEHPELVAFAKTYGLGSAPAEPPGNGGSDTPAVPATAVLDVPALAQVDAFARSEAGQEASDDEARQKTGEMADEILAAVRGTHDEEPASAIPLDRVSLPAGVISRVSEDGEGASAHAGRAEARESELPIPAPPAMADERDPAPTDVSPSDPTSAASMRRAPEEPHPAAPEPAASAVPEEPAAPAAPAPSPAAPAPSPEPAVPSPEPAVPSSAPAALSADDQAKLAALDEQAKKFESMKRWPDLIKSLQAMAALVPDPAEKVAIYTRIAKLFIERFSNQAEAIKAFEAVIEIDGSNAEATDFLKQMYEKRRDWDKLVGILRREADRLTEVADRTSRYVEMAQLATDKIKRPNICIELWQKVLEGDEMHEGALTALSGLYERNKDWGLLAAVLEKEVELTADAAARINLLQKLGMIYGDKLNDDAGAVRAWKALLELQPGDRRAQEQLKKRYLALGAWDALEEFYAEGGKWDEFIRVLEREVEQPNATDATKVQLLFKLAQLWREKKEKIDRSAKCYEKVLSIEPRDLDAALALIPIYEGAQDHKHLAGAIEVQLGHATDPGERLELLRRVAGLYADKTREAGKAFDRYVTAIEVAPDEEWPRAELEKMAAETHRWEEVVGSYRKALEAVRDLDLELRMARVLNEELSRQDESLAVYQAVLADEPENREAIAALERLYAAMGRHEDLLGVFQKRMDLSLDPEERKEILYGIASLWEDQLGDLARAIATYVEITEAAGDEPRALSALDRLYLKTEDYLALAQILERELQQSPDDADLKFRLGQVVEQHLADTPRAIGVYREILDESPAHEPARGALEALLGHPDHRGEAARILEPIYEARADWGRLVEVDEILFATEEDVPARVALLQKIGRTWGTRLADPQKAFEAHSRAFKIDPTAEEPRVDLEKLSEILESWSEHVELLEGGAGAVEDPALARELWLKVASIYDERIGDPDLAVDAYNRVLAIDPQDATALEALEGLFNRTERWQDLIRVYRKKAELTFDATQKEAIFGQMAFIYDEMLSDPAEAITCHREILAIDATSEKALRALDSLFRRQEMWPDLADNLTQQLSLAADDAAAQTLQLRLASLREKQMGQVEAAIEIYREVIEKDSSNDEALTALERLQSIPAHELTIATILEPIYRNAQEHHKLIAVYEIMIARGEDPGAKVELLHKIGELYEIAADDPQKSFETYARALAFDPANPDTQNAIDRFARVLGAWPELARVYEQRVAAVEDPELQALLHAKAAQIYEEQLRDVDGAVGHHREVLRIDSQNLEAASALERLFQLSERYEDLARIYLTKAEILQDPDEKKDHLFRASRIYEEVLERPDDAVAVFLQILEIDPEEMQALDKLIELYLRLEQWERLLGVYQKKADLVSDIGLKKTLYYEVGTVYERELADVPHAIDTYQHILEFDPDDFPSIQRLDALYQASEAWHELLSILEREAELATDPNEVISFKYRISELWEKRLGDVTRAIEGYREILDVASDHEPTLAALEGLISQGQEANAAAGVLEPVYKAAGEWEKLIHVHEVQLEHCDDAFRSVELFHQIAELYEMQLSNDRSAFDTYARALQADNGNERTLASLERLAEQVNGWADLAGYYDRELERALEPERAVDIAARAARVFEEQLGDVENAIARHRKVLEFDAENRVAIHALDRLFGGSSRWVDLAEILRREVAIADSPEAILELQFRLGQLYQEELEDLDAAIECYREILAAAPEHDQTLNALEFLFAEGTKQPEIAQILEPLYRMSDEWQKLVGIYEVQLEKQPDPLERVQMIHRIAELQEEKLSDLGQAFAWQGRAFKEDPGTERTVEELERLARATDSWEDLCNIYLEVLGVTQEPDGQKTIAKRVARIYEEEMQETRRAEEIYTYVLEVDGLDAAALAALDRLYGDREAWEPLGDVLRKRIRIAESDEAKVDLMYRLGELSERELNLPDDAVRLYNDILANLDAQHGPSIKNLQNLYVQLGDYPNLFAVYEKELDIVSGDSAQADIFAKMASLASEQLDDVQKAVEIWNKVLDIRGEDAEALGALAILYERQENWRDLVDVLERQVATAGDENSQVAIYQKLGEVWGVRLGRDRNALENWQKVLDIDPGNMQALRALAGVYRNTQAWDELVSTLNRLIEVGLTELGDEEVREIYASLGELYGDTLMQPYEAVESWRKVLEVEPTDMRALAALERLHTQEGQWEECVAVLGRKADALQEPQERIDVYLQIAGMWDDKLGDRDSAGPAYQSILGIDPLHEQAFRALESLYRDGMSYEKLIELYFARIEAVEDVAARVELLQSIARVYEKDLSKPAEAFESLKMAFELDYANEKTADELERLASVTGNWTELLNSCNAVLQTVQDRRVRIELCLKIGKWYGEQLGHPEYAIPYYSQALTEDPDNANALRLLGELYRRTSQWQPLGQCLARQAEVTTDPDDKKEVLLQLGELQEEQLGQPDHAIKAYRQALDLDKLFGPALAALERLYRQSESWEALIGILERRAEAAENPDEQVELRLRIGELEEDRLADPAAAIKVYREILAADASCLPAMKGLERLYAKAERWQDLLDVLELELDSVTTERERITLLARMAGMLEEEFVKPDKAAERLEQVVEIDPQNENALKGLERLYRHQQRWHELIDSLVRHIGATSVRAEKVAMYEQIGQVYADEIGDPERAIEAYRNVLDLDEDHVGALDALTRLSEKIEDFAGALETMGRLVLLVRETEPVVELHHRMGRILDERMNDREAAVERYQNALDLEPGHLPSLGCLRAIHYDREDWPSAVRVLEQEQQHTENARARAKLLYEMGRICAERLDEAERSTGYYVEALRSDEENEDAALPLVEHYIERREWASAEPLLDMLVRKGAKREPAEAQRLHYQLGMVTSELGKDDKSLKAFQAAYNLDQSHLPTLKGIANAFYKKSDWDRSFKFYQMILVHHREAQTDAEIVEIFYRLGRIKLEVGERRKALNMFDKALEIDAKHRTTLEAVIGLHEKQNEWEQVIHFKRQMLAGVDEEEAYAILIEVGDIWQEKLNNGQKAIQTFTEALERRPGSYVVLHKLLELYHGTKQWKKAVEVLTRITSLEKDSTKLAKYFYTIAAIHRDEIKDIDAAIAAFNQALDHNYEHLKAFEAIDRILTQKKDWKELERNYRKMLHRIAGKGKTDVEVNLWHFLGEIYRTRMGQFEPAAEAFRMAARLDPANAQRHEILAELFMSIAGKHQEAVEEHRFLIDQNPWRVDSYKALRKIFFDSRQYDKAWCLCATLSYLKKADPEEQQFYEQYRTKGPVKAQARVDEERWVKDLFHPQEDLYIGKIFAALTPALRALKVRPQKDYGLKKKDRRDPLTDTVTFSKMFGYVAQVLNLPLPELYLRPDQQGGLAFAITEPAASVVGASLLSGYSPQDLTFIIAKHLSYYRSEHYIRWITPTTAELRTLLLAGIKMAAPKFNLPPDPSGVIEQTAAALAKGMAPLAYEDLGRVVRRFIEANIAVDLKKWTQAVELTACRAGLLLCNDLEITARLIQGEPPGAGDMPVKEKLKELVLFSISEEYFRLRQGLGIAIASEG
ncbi:MAG: tetratricopeptide repeat protein [Deltaproteobacteria bacterium]|nr:tetratricopeptide repeat protein [Deltaproteobacteria bacterium]